MLDILYRDDYFVAIHKPAGLLVHRSGIDRHETRFALQLLRDQIGQRVYPVHRLDKPTSGPLLFALDPLAARLLTQVFTEQQVDKTYLALVRGYTDLQGIIDYPLKEELDKITDRKANPDKAAQTAMTHYQRLAQVELPFPVGRYRSCRYSLLKITPKSGRKHQIRRHMKHIFHPIVGDTTHGDGKHNQFFRSHFNCWRLLLAATELAFQHPLTQQPVRIVAPLAGDFFSLLQQLELTAALKSVQNTPASRPAARVIPSSSH